MKPSQAMRLGCLYIPAQCHERFFSWNDGDVIPFAACAIGAMAYGFDVNFNGWEGFDASGYSNELNEFLFRPIEAAHLPSVVEDIPTDRPAPLFEDAIIHLNDRVQWPREIIAGWLESIGY